MAPTPLGLPSVPVTGKNDSIQCRCTARLAASFTAYLHVEDRLSAGEHLLQDRLDRRRKPRHDFPHGPAEMVFDGQPVHLGQGLIDLDIPQVLVQEGKSGRGDAEKGFQLPHPQHRLVLQPLAIGDVDDNAGGAGADDGLRLRP